MQEFPLTGWLTTSEASTLTGFHPGYLRELAREGKVTARQVGRSWLYQEASLRAYRETVKAGRPKREH